MRRGGQNERKRAASNIFFGISSVGNKKENYAPSAPSTCDCHTKLETRSEQSSVHGSAQQQYYYKKKTSVSFCLCCQLSLCRLLFFPPYSGSVAAMAKRLGNVQQCVNLFCFMHFNLLSSSSGDILLLVCWHIVNTRSLITRPQHYAICACTKCN